LHTTFLQAETGFIEALVSIYELEALPLFERAVDDGMYKLSRVVPTEQQHCLPYVQQESLPFFNVNYPADLEMARRIIAAI
jgi:molybdenum cofactor guanylyltransferase